MRRYQIEYSFDARRKRNHIRGYTETLAAACASAVRHIARSEFDKREYHAAVILDRKTGKLVRKYHLLPSGTIQITNFQEKKSAEIIHLRRGTERTDFGS